MITDIFVKASKTTSKVVSRAGLKLAKHSPDILVGVGVAGVVATVVLACKKTHETEEIFEEMDGEMVQLENHQEGYTEKEYKKELTKVYFDGGVKLAKHYAPVIFLGCVSIGCIIGGHYILKKRYLGVVAAYKALDESYKEYRRKIIENLGEDADRYYKHGIKDGEVEVAETDEDGNETVKVVDRAQGSQYAKFYDESCPNWTKDPATNMFNLLNIQRTCNERLKARGHLFLNEVYDEIGIERTRAGSVVGWVLGNGDDYVDFGIFDKVFDANRRFVNGLEPVILLDFNVDGVIWDKI